MQLLRFLLGRLYDLLLDETRGLTLAKDAFAETSVRNGCG